MTKRLVQGNEPCCSRHQGRSLSLCRLSDQPVVRDPGPGLRVRGEPSEFRFLQEEDEIASANAILGASLAGAKSFTATSGPGFSLMQEAIGYGHKVGIPCVIVNVMRVGPATGMPTMPGQGDLNQAATARRATTPASSSTRRPWPSATSTRSTPSTRGGEPKPGHSPFRRVLAISTKSRTWTRSTCRSSRERWSLSPRAAPALLGVATYPDGEPATADADEFIRSTTSPETTASRWRRNTPSTSTAGTRSPRRW